MAYSKQFGEARHGRKSGSHSATVRSRSLAVISDNDSLRGQMPRNVSWPGQNQGRGSRMHGVDEGHFEYRMRRRFPHGQFADTVPQHHTTNPLYQSPRQVGRRFFPINEIPSGRKNTFNFTVLSYNVLSDSLLWQHEYLYADCPEWTLQWEYRKKNLMKEIINYNADVICLQEVQANHFADWFKPELVKCGYIGIYKKKTGEKTDGCAVFYRQSRFTLKSYRTVEYQVPNHSLMNRDNIGIIVELCCIEKGVTLRKPSIIVANTHILFNKKRGDIKLLQLGMLFAEIDEIAKISMHQPKKGQKKNLFNPIIVCGDFNSLPFSPLLEFATKGHLRYDGTSRATASGQVSQCCEHEGRSKSMFHSDRVLEELGITGLCQKQPEGRTSEQSKINEHRDGLPDSSFSKHNGDRIVAGSRTAEEIEEKGVLKHNLELRSVYRHHQGRETASSNQGTVDYILFSQGQMPFAAEDGSPIELRRRLYLSGVLALLLERDFSKLQSLPNPVLSSDHLALLATFRLC